MIEITLNQAFDCYIRPYANKAILKKIYFDSIWPGLQKNFGLFCDNLKSKGFKII